MYYQQLIVFLMLITRMKITIFLILVCEVAIGRAARIINVIEKEEIEGHRDVDQFFVYLTGTSPLYCHHIIQA